MKHAVLHLLACILPLLAIFLLPLFGLGGGVALVLAFVFLFACHLFMMRGHDHLAGAHHHPHSDDTSVRRS